jgi:hypothetical protein
MPSRGSVISAVAKTVEIKTAASASAAGAAGTGKSVVVGTNASREVHREQTFKGDGDEVDEDEWA